MKNKYSRIAGVPDRSMGGLDRDNLMTVRSTLANVAPYTTSLNRIGGAIYVGTVHIRRNDGPEQMQEWVKVRTYMCDAKRHHNKRRTTTCCIRINADRMTLPLLEHAPNYATEMSYRQQFVWMAAHWSSPEMTIVGWMNGGSRTPFYPDDLDDHPITTKYSVHILLSDDCNSMDTAAADRSSTFNADVVLKLPKLLLGTASHRGVACELCLQPYSQKWFHRCKFKCNMCDTVGETHSTPWRPRNCKQCNRRQANQECHEAHIKNGMCDRIRKCPKCKSTFMSSAGTHKCRKKFACTVCEMELDTSKMHKNFPNEKADFQQRHQFECYVPAYQVKKRRQELFIAFDVEVEQFTADAAIEGHMLERSELTPQLLNANLHKVICVCAQVFCRTCMNEPAGAAECKICKHRDRFFYGSNSLDMFCEWLFSVECKGRTVFAHNYGRYDAVFLTKWLLEHGYNPTIVSVGLRIMKMSLQKHRLTFLDSINYLPFPLEELATSFAKGVALKGFFPFLMPPPYPECAVQDGLPDQRFFCTAQMKSNRLKEFNIWYDANKDLPFGYRDECIKYCMNDVDILRVSLIGFMNMFEAVCGGMCVFSNGCTLSAVINNFYRATMMPVDKIPIIANNEQYHRESRQSRMGIVYIKCMMEYMDVDISYVRNSGEVILAGKYPCDGVVICPKTRRVTHIFCYDGCFFHGCVRCHPTDRHRVQFGTESIETLFERTTERDTVLRQKFPYAELIVKRTCDFQEDLRDEPALLAIYDRVSEAEEIRELDDVTPLNCRHAYFGGRSETFATGLEAVTAEGQEVKYIDICSAYPYALRECAFGVGHPIIRTDKLFAADYRDPSAFEFFGFVKCRILAPRRGRRHHAPLLPMRINSKLYFALCAKCAELSRHNIRCTHNERDRSWIGTYTAMELKLAVQNGYVVMEVFEEWHWPKTMQVKKTYDPVTHEWTIDEHGLYSMYVQTFLRIKHMAKGYPAHVITEEDQRLHVEELYRKDGIRLEIWEVVENKQLYILAKLALNSFYGKLGQRAGGRTIHEYVTTKDRFDELNNANNVSLDIRSSELINEDCIHFQFQMRESHLETLKHVCVAHAAYVTAMTRCIMYEQLSKLNMRVLACDTDSLMYIHMPPPDDGAAIKSDARLKYESLYGLEDCYYEPPIGSSLGSWGNEFKEDQLCYAGYSTGPKSYGLLMRQRNAPYTELDSIVRSKGLSRSHRTDQDLNGNAYKAIIDDTMVWLDETVAIDCDDEDSAVAAWEVQPHRMIKQVKFIRTIYQRMYTRDSEKIFRCTFTKRMVVRDTNGAISPYTWPFGHLDCYGANSNESTSLSVASNANAALTTDKASINHEI